VKLYQPPINLSPGVQGAKLNSEYLAKGIWLHALGACVRMKIEIELHYCIKTKVICLLKIQS